MQEHYQLQQVKEGHVKRMLPRKETSRKSSARASKSSSSSAKLDSISTSASQIVRDAASLLDEELAAGILTARQMQQRFRKERRVSSDDFKDALQKFQGDAHHVVDLLNKQLEQLQSGKDAQMINGLVANAHDLLNLAVEFVNTGANLVNQMIERSPINKGQRRASRSR
jgi:hypothetical protein